MTSSAVHRTVADHARRITFRALQCEEIIDNMIREVLPPNYVTASVSNVKRDMNHIRTSIDSLFYPRLTMIKADSCDGFNLHEKEAKLASFSLS